MRGTRPPFKPKKLLLAGASIAVPTATGFLSNTGALGLVVPLAFLSMAMIPVFLISAGGYRPDGGRWLFLPTLVLFIGSLFPAAIGGHSLWLTAFGENVHCRVESIERHKSTRGSDSFSGHLVCGDRKLSYRPSKFRQVEPVGSEIDIVVDRTGFFTSLEADQVSWRYNLVFWTGLLMSAAFLLLIALFPVREPELTAQNRK